MALPLLATKPLTINARVTNFMPGTEENPRQSVDCQARIEQAYRQIFFHAFKVDREVVLESQLRTGQISTRQFIRGLLLSDKFRNDFYRCNSNYRVVEQVVGRVLGRPVHGDSERIAWSIVIAEQGLPGFVDALLDSDEYLQAFGDDQVPYQRSRVLAGQAVGDRPFNQQAPRYDSYWRDMTAHRAPAGDGSSTWVQGQPPAWAQRVWYGFIAIGSLELARVLVATVGAMLSTAGQG